MAKEKTQQPEERTFMVRLPKEMHISLKLLAAELNISMAALIREAIEAFILSKEDKGKDRAKKKKG